MIDQAARALALHVLNDSVHDRSAPFGVGTVGVEWADDDDTLPRDDDMRPEWDVEAFYRDEWQFIRVHVVIELPGVRVVSSGMDGVKFDAHRRGYDDYDVKHLTEVIGQEINEAAGKLRESNA